MRNVFPPSIVHAAASTTLAKPSLAALIAGMAGGKGKTNPNQCDRILGDGWSGNRPKPRNYVLLCGIAIAIFFGVPAQAGVIVDYNFNSLTAGNLAGQDGWVTPPAGQLSPQVVSGPVGSINTSQTASNSTTATSASVNSRPSFSAGTLTASLTQVTLTFDLYIAGATSIAGFGIGVSNYNGNMPGYFGVQTGLWAVRMPNYGTVFNPVNSSGVALAPDYNEWYSVQSVWNLQTNTASLSIKNLTDGETTYTPLYFNTAQTQSTVSIAGPGWPVNTWTNAYIRTGTSATNLSYVDNLHVNTVPEPSALVLGLLSAGLLLLRRRRPTGKAH